MFSLLVWAIAEGFGGPYGSGSTDIGTSIIYALFFVGLLVLAYYAGTDRYSVDYHLEQKVSWWWRVAELRRPFAGRPVAATLVPAQTAAVTPDGVPQLRTDEPVKTPEPAGPRSS